ncbi:peptide deformylase [candidate division WOR-3 bacterium]|nr:peptide deformylase [candidate division WOR-3 bacterium]HHD82645.1 peptide deformylase [Bacteroidota bacterium]
MSLLNIRVYPDPILKEKIPESNIADEQLIKYFKIMPEIMYDNNGAGLAAPQIGIKERIITLDVGDGLLFMINPIIVEKSKEEETDEEGCLSVPGTYLDIIRSKSVTVEYYDEKLKKRSKKLKELAARAVQHEIDHLNGIIILDRVDRKTRLKAEMEYMDYIKKRY